MNGLLAAALLGMAVTTVTAGSGDVTIRTDEVGSNPVKGEVHEKVALGAKARVEVHGIGGSAEVMAIDGNEVRIDYERKAATRQDYDCEKLRFEKQERGLRIWLERDRSGACRSIRASDKLKLGLPRQADIVLSQIGDSARISGVQGLVELSSIGDSAVLEGVSQLMADSIGDSLKVSLSSLGPAGVKINSVGDSVTLQLPQKIDARLEIDSVGDSVHVDGLERRRHRDDDGDENSVSTVLGEGGRIISINSVGDSVTVRR